MDVFIVNYWHLQRDNVTLEWLPRAQEDTREASKFYHYKQGFLNEALKCKNQNKDVEKCEEIVDLVRRLKIVSRCGSRPSPNDVRLTQIQTEMETMCVLLVKIDYLRPIKA